MQENVDTPIVDEASIPSEEAKVKKTRKKKVEDVSNASTSPTASKANENTPDPAPGERQHMNVDLAKFNATQFGITFSSPSAVEGAVCEDVTPADVTDEHIELTKNMLKLLAASNGLGLAAPQIGINKRFFVYWETRQNKPHCCYNAKYYGIGKKKNVWGERCLTYGNLTFAIRRYKEIQAVWYEYDPDKKDLVKVTRALKGLEAEVFQHETDHLNGITIATEGMLIR